MIFMSHMTNGDAAYHAGLKRLQERRRARPCPRSNNSRIAATRTAPLLSWAAMLFQVHAGHRVKLNSNTNRDGTAPSFSCSLFFRLFLDWPEGVAENKVSH